MTANAMEGDREKVLDAGMCDHVSKPLNVEQMFVTLARWIGPRRVQAAKPATAPPERPAARGAAGPAKWPGIDEKAGLAITLGDEKLYLRLLTRFRDGQGGFDGLFAAACADADASAPGRAAHTLKALAGTIGAGGVQTAAAALEQACLVGAERVHIEALLAETLVQLTPVIMGLQGIPDVPELDGDAGEAAVTLAMDAEDLRQRRGRLAKLLIEGDMEAVTAAEALASVALRTPMEPTFKRVARLAADCDFDAALAALNQGPV